MKKSIGFRLVALAVLLFLLFSFAACTESESGGTEQPDDNGQGGSLITDTSRTIAVYNGVNVSIDKYVNGYELTATADDLPGKVFVCWNRNNERYTYDKTFSYVVSENCVFKAVYSTETVISLDAAGGVLSVFDKGSVNFNQKDTRKVSPQFRIEGTPEICGVMAAEQTLSVNIEPLGGGCSSFVYTWERAETADGRYTAIQREDGSVYTGETYVLSTEDIGSYVRVTLTAATGSGYTGSVSSDPTPKIAIAAAAASATVLTPSDVSGNKNGVSFGSLSVVTGYYYTLPVPKRSRYTFIGWFNGDEKIAGEDGFALLPAAESVTLTAKYSEKGKMTLKTVGYIGDTEIMSDVQSHYLETGSVYLTAEMVTDHECVAWESYYIYRPLAQEPDDWSDNYNRYYYLENDSYVPNVGSTWNDEVVYAYRETLGVEIKQKPSDWATDYTFYFRANFLAADSSLWIGAPHYSANYVQVTDKPSDWEENYALYFIYRNGTYYANSTKSWGVNNVYALSYTRLTEKPDDWERSYHSYYNLSFVRNDSPVWAGQGVYYDFRVNEESDPTTVIVRLTGMKENTYAEYAALYREAYRVSVSGGTGTGYYGVEESISLRAVVTSGKAFYRWAVECADGTVYPARTDLSDNLAFVKAHDGGQLILVYLDGDTVRSTPFYVPNLSDDFNEGGFVKEYFSVLTAQPSDWAQNYASYYQLSGGVFAPNDSNVWSVEKTYAESVEETGGIYAREYELLTEQPSDWNENKTLYYFKSGPDYFSVNEDAVWTAYVYYAVVYNRLTEEPDDWATNYTDYYTVAATYVGANESIRLSQLQDVGVTVTGGCRVVAEFEKTNYILRYELNLNVGNNRISDDDPTIKDYLNSIGFYDNDDGVFVYEETLHYNDTIDWVRLRDISHYDFNDWQPVGGGQKPRTMPRLDAGEAYTVVGMFTAERYFVRISSDEHGSVGIGSTTGDSSGYGSYGGYIRIFVTAEPGYQFSSWTYGNNKVLTVDEPDSILTTAAPADTTQDTVIYYFLYHVTGERNDENKNIKCNFTEREYEITYRLTYLYDDEDVTGIERFSGAFSSFEENGLTFSIRDTGTRYYNVYYGQGGSLSVADLNDLLSYYGIPYSYNGPITGTAVDLLSVSLAKINAAQFYKLPVVHNQTAEGKYILFSPYAETTRIEYVAEISSLYREELIGKIGYAVTAVDHAFYNATTRLIPAPTAATLNLPFPLYWEFSGWTANDSDANQNPSSFVMPKKSILVEGSYSVYKYDLTIGAEGLGMLGLTYTTINGRSPLYYGSDDRVLTIPYASDVVVDYSLRTGFDFTEIRYIVDGVERFPAYTKTPETGSYLYQIAFSFESGKNATYSFGSANISSSLTSYIRVNRENAASSDYLLGATGLNVDRSRSVAINDYVYYFYRIRTDMIYDIRLADCLETPSDTLLTSCNYTRLSWQYCFLNDGVATPYSGTTMPDDNLIAYLTLEIKTYRAEIPLDITYEFDPMDANTGIYIANSPTVVSTGSGNLYYDFYTEMDFSYVLPLGFHFVNWTITNLNTSADTVLNNAFYFRRTFERLTETPADWLSKYTSYFVLQSDGKYKVNDISIWDSTKNYYRLTGMYSLPDFPSNRVERSDLYGFYMYTTNADSEFKPTNDVFYVKPAYLLSSTRPADWATSYGSYFTRSGEDYLPVTAFAEWTADTYYYLGFERLMEKPANWDSQYRTYYKASPSTYIYKYTTNEYDVDYYRYNLIALIEMPADWETNYLSYYVSEDGSRFVKNTLLYWNESYIYAKVGYVESVAGTPADIATNGDLYGKYLHRPNTDAVWDENVTYARTVYRTLMERPSDWATNYGNYFVLVGTNYVANVSAVWDAEKEYAFLCYESLDAIPADWDTNYGSYYRLVELPDWYTVGKKATMVDIRLFLTDHTRASVVFTKDTFLAIVRYEGPSASSQEGAVMIGQTGTSSGNFKKDRISFQYHSTVTANIIGGLSDGLMIESIVIYYANEENTDYDSTRLDQIILTPVDEITYEYLETTYITDNYYTENIYVVIKLAAIQYRITYQLYANLDDLTGFNAATADKVTLALPENVTEGDFYDLKSKFRIGFNEQFALNDFLTSTEVLSLLTDEQVASIGGGARSTYLIVNWFLNEPSASTVQGDILSSYTHTTKDKVDKNLTVYGFILNLFVMQVTGDENAIGFNTYITSDNGFGTVYDRNISQLVIPDTFRTPSGIKAVTQYGFTSSGGVKYYFQRNAKLTSVSCPSTLRSISKETFLCRRHLYLGRGRFQKLLVAGQYRLPRFPRHLWRQRLYGHGDDFGHNVERTARRVPVPPHVRQRSFLFYPHADRRLFRL